MNLVRMTYLILNFTYQMILLAIIILSPIYITPGYYWWTFVAFILFTAGGDAFTARVNSWQVLGRY